MTISIFIYSMSGGGAERVVSYLLPYLKSQGHVVHLVLMNNTISYDVPNDILIHYLEKSKPFENGFFKLFKLPFLAYKYSKLVKKLNITHSFSLLSRPNYVNILMKTFNKKPPIVIVSERNYASMQYGYGDLQSKINNFLVKKLYPKADHVIGNSIANVKDLVDNYGVNLKKTSVIQNPIDLEKIENIQPLSDFFDSNYFNMITVGRLETVKNQQLLIRAISEIPNTRLYLLGQGPLKDNLKQLVIDLNISDRIYFLGFDSNPYKYLKSADLFVFGSNHEGFPNVVLEAMTCGLPILSTNCKSGPNEILQLEIELENDIMKTKHGILTPVGNIQLMTKGMQYFVENADYLNSCKSNVLERVQDFKKDEVLKNYENNLAKL